MQAWQAVPALGFGGGRVLEPGCGSGNFIAFAPAGASDRRRAGPGDRGHRGPLYPYAEIRAERSPTAPTGRSYDLAIGNVPFGNMVLHDHRHNPGGHSIHNHFIIKALHLVRPGGLALSSPPGTRWTPATRPPAGKSPARRPVGAVRLPGGPTSGPPAPAWSPTCWCCAAASQAAHPTDSWEQAPRGTGRRSCPG